MPALTKRAVTIRGVTYASTTEAAAALGVSKAAISHAKWRGTLDNVGSGKGSAKGRYRAGKAITLFGVTYMSRREAARALGVGLSYIYWLAKQVNQRP